MPDDLIYEERISSLRTEAVLVDYPRKVSCNVEFSGVSKNSN
jgi:hypothetical protein